MKIQVIVDSTYEQVHRLAEALAASASETPDAELSLESAPERTPDEAPWKSGAMAARAVFADVRAAKPEPMAEADELDCGTPGCFGKLCSQMRNYLDRTGAL